MRRDELIRLRAIKPDPSERQHANSIPPEKAVPSTSTPSPKTQAEKVQFEQEQSLNYR